MDDYDRAAVAMADRQEDSVDETRGFFEARLSRHLPEKLIEDLFEVQLDLRTEQDKLVRLMDSGEISRESYFNNFNRMLRYSLLRSRELLGEKDFIAVYGEDGLSPEGVIDPEIFFAGHHAA